MVNVASCKNMHTFKRKDLHVPKIKCYIILTIDKIARKSIFNLNDQYK